MAIQIQGNGSTVAEVDGTGFRALRVSARPTDYGTLGHYNWGGPTGVLPAALAANSEVFQFRWTDATRFAVIQRIRLSAAVSTTFFVAGAPVQIEMVKSTAWTVQGTGGTGITIGANLKKRNSMGSSLVAAGDIRISSTAALGAGTKTLDTNAMTNIVAPGPTASPGVILPAGSILWEQHTGDGEMPLVLVQNEGISVRVPNVPGTGTWQMSVDISWAEVAAF